MNSSFPKDTPTYFADAETGMKDAEFVLFGIPFERTVTFRKGTKNGPINIRQASWSFESFNLHTDIDLSTVALHDYGDLLEIDNLKPEEMIGHVRTLTDQILSHQKIPIALGGEHSLSAGVVEALPKETMVLVFDAHADFRDRFQKSSYNHACTIRRIADHIPHDNIIVCGLRSAGKNEYQELKQTSIQTITSYDIQQYGIDNYIDFIKSKLNNKILYISIDIDVIDPGFAPGVGTPEPFGLSPFDLISCINQFAAHIIGFDVTEVNPLFDTGQTSILAAKIIRHTIERIVSSGKNDRFNIR